MRNDVDHFPAILAPGGQGMIEQAIGQLHTATFQAIAEAQVDAIFPGLWRTLHQIWSQKGSALFLAVRDTHAGMSERLTNPVGLNFFQSKDPGSLGQAKAGMIVEQASDQRANWLTICLLNHCPQTALTLFW